MNPLLYSTLLGRPILRACGWAEGHWVPAATVLPRTWHLLGLPAHWFADSAMPRDNNIPVLGFHLISVTTLSVLFVLTGLSLRFGGFPFFS